MPIFDGQLAAIMSELEGGDPEDFQFQVGVRVGGWIWGYLCRYPCAYLQNPYTVSWLADLEGWAQFLMRAAQKCGNTRNLVAWVS